MNQFLMLLMLRRRMRNKQKSKIFDYEEMLPSHEILKKIKHVYKELGLDQFKIYTDTRNTEDVLHTFENYLSFLGDD